MQGHQISISGVDHIGVRVADVDRALAFYGLLGFRLFKEIDYDAVVIIRNDHGVELNLIVNANDPNGGKNVLMDDDTKKYAGFTHVALRVDSVRNTLAALKANGVEISQGPVQFGMEPHVSVFVRDPDRNVIELRGRDEDPASIDGVTIYTPG